MHKKRLVTRKKISWGWFIFWVIVFFPIAIIQLLTAKTITEEE